MATLEELVAAAVLVRHEADLEDWELPVRCLFLAKGLDDWLENVLPTVPAKAKKKPKPSEEVGQLFFEFVVGRPMAYSVDYRKLDPLGLHVWELKTEEVRIFGWFYKKGHFIACCGDLKDNLSKAKQNKSTNELYKPHIDGVCDYREKLQLDGPKHITAVSHEEVL